MYGLFVLLTLVLLLNPVIVKNMYGSILGRLVFLILIIFFAINNATLGLLLGLVIIVASQMYVREGMETALPDEKKSSVTPPLPVTAPASGTTVASTNATTKSLTDTLNQLQGVIANAKPTSSASPTVKPDTGKPADLLSAENSMKPKESFTMMGTTFKTHNPDVAAYSPVASFSSF